MNAADLLPFRGWPVVIPLHWDHPDYRPGEGLRALDPEAVESALRASSPLAVLLLALLRLPHTITAPRETVGPTAAADLCARLWGMTPREALIAALKAPPRDPAELSEIVRRAEEARAERAERAAAKERAHREEVARVEAARAEAARAQAARRDVARGAALRERIREVNARMPAPTPPEPVTCSGPPNRNPDAHLIVVFGSAARRALGQTAECPRDVDAVFCGVPRELAELRVAAWAQAQGLGDIPIQAQEYRAANGPVPATVQIGAIDDADREAHVVLHGGGVEICRPVRPSVAADLRVLAVRGRWPERTHAQLALTPRESPYFGDGLQALRTAWRKLDGQQQLSAARRYGPVLLTLLERDPTPAELAQVEDAMPGGCARGDAGLRWSAVEGAERWRVSTPYRAWPAGWLT